MDATILTRIKAVTIDQTVQAVVDPIIVLSDTLRGGSRRDVDRIRAREKVTAAQQRATRRPSISNGDLARQFARPAMPQPDRAASPNLTDVVAVRLPPPGKSECPEIVLFWAAMQLLPGTTDPAVIDSATREVRAACGAAWYARSLGVDDRLIDDSLTDIVMLCAALLNRRDIAASTTAITGVEDDPAEKAVKLLASGLPSTARLQIQELW
ncbi:hypothetical protein KO481_16895 [Nocardia sp. NEAU-G5]|uniref:Uncharacterized protein n=1 Tax=Nocardia albiluteola TaxID=2842303 RepID=A0ABS6AYT2_9NOCA|nr:hypothetical protein [Nocardia albiluteola]MBU3063199.1 hypothetical protein [Nocardia albiluteola]